MKKTFKIGIIATSILFILLIAFSYIFKIRTNYYCCESPTYRWKFAIYCGECNDETGCYFHKMEGTGVLEYFGCREIDCPENP